MGAAVGLGVPVGLATGGVVDVGDGLCEVVVVPLPVRSFVAAPPDPPTEPRLVPVASDPPRMLASGLPSRPSAPVTAPSVRASTAAAASEIRAQASGPRGACDSGASGSTTGAVAAVRVHWVAVRRIASVLRRRDEVYIALATVAITLATAAPMMVPATPRKDAPNAADAAARALATSWLALRPSRCSRRSSRSVGEWGRGVGPVFGSWGDMQHFRSGTLPYGTRPGRDRFHSGDVMPATVSRMATEAVTAVSFQRRTPASM